MEETKYRCPNCHAADGFEVTLEMPVKYTIDDTGEVMDQECQGGEPDEEMGELDNMFCNSCSYEAQVRHFRAAAKIVVIRNLPAVKP